MHPEVARIVQLARHDYFSPELTAKARARYEPWFLLPEPCRPRCVRCEEKYKRGLKGPCDVRELWPAQAAVLWAAEECGGVLGVLDVGDGKTLPAMLMQELFNLTALFLVPASLVDKTRQDWVCYSRNWRIRPLHVYSYEMLSRKESSDLLTRLGSLLIVCDEGHKLKHLTAARTKRFMRHAKGTPNLRLGIFSASLAQRVKALAHLSELVLRERSPLPRTHEKEVLESFSRAIDDPDNSGFEPDVGELVKYFAPEGSQATHGREAYRRRLRSAPGIVMSVGDGEEAAGAALTIRMLRNVGMPNDVKDLIRHVSRTGERPDGELLVHSRQASQVWRCCQHLSAGFYYKWLWPNGQADIEWMDGRRRWHKALREELEKHSREGYDSPALVGAAIARGERPHTELESAWRAWQPLRERWKHDGGKEGPPTETVWVWQGLVHLAVAMAQISLERNEPRICWVHSEAMQRELKKYGLDVRGRGTQPPTVPRGMHVLSWDVHREGANLQYGWHRNLVLEPPPSAEFAEQMLGRTHRKGQPEDEVEVDWAHHTESLQEQWERVLERARVLEESTGQRQKVLRATVLDEDPRLRRAA